MKSMVTKQDMRMMEKIFKYTSPEKLPISFTYNGKKYEGIIAEWNPSVERQLADSTVTAFVIRAMVDEILEVKVEVKEYRDYPVTEFAAFFTNMGDRDTGIVSDIRIAEGVIEGGNPVFVHSNGDTCPPWLDCYEWRRESLVFGEAPISIYPIDGTSCKGAFPYMRLMFDGFGVNIAVGWTGKWVASAERTARGAAVSFGQKRCHFVIRPGETMRTPRVNLQVFSGDETRGMQMWRRWYFDHILPREDGRPLPPKHCGVCLSEGGAAEFAGATEAGQIRALETYASKGIYPDIWWIDAGWYPCDYNWAKVGTWRHDPVRFPNGLGAVGRKCREHGAKLLLWFEPERVAEGSEIYEEHPEWLLWAFAYGEKGALLNLGERACCNDLIERVDRAIKEYEVGVYRQDFNMNPEPFWVKYETADRIGAMENLHIQGLYRFWDTLLERNPGLWIDCCSSGGRRNDLEAMRRAVPLHFTDVGYGHHPMKQKQHRVMFEWIPYFRAQNQNWENPGDSLYYKYRDQKPDRFSYYNSIAPAFTELMPWDASEEEYALSREMLSIWRRAAEIMLDADYYPLTECRKAREDFYAMYFYNPDEKRGFLQAIRNNACPEERFTACLTALDANVSYRLTNPETGEEKVMTGKALAEGFTMTVERRAGQIWLFEKV